MFIVVFFSADLREGLFSHFPEEELSIVELQCQYAFPSLVFRSEPRNGNCA